MTGTRVISCPYCKAIGDMAVHPRNPFMGTFRCFECGYRANGFLAGCTWSMFPIRKGENQ